MLAFKKIIVVLLTTDKMNWYVIKQTLGYGRYIKMVT